MMPELKPCPFCGGEAKLKHIGNEHCKKMMTEITCGTLGCFATQRVATLHNRHSFSWCDEKCVEHWNTRPDGGDSTPALRPREVIKLCAEWLRKQGDAYPLDIFPDPRPDDKVPDKYASKMARHICSKWPAFMVRDVTEQLEDRAEASLAAKDGG